MPAAAEALLSALAAGMQVPALLLVAAIQLVDTLTELH
jgi:hypothetical protein